MLLIDLYENERGLTAPPSERLIGINLSSRLSRSFVPRVSAPEAGYPGALGPPDGPDAPASHRHHCRPTERDGFPAGSDKTLRHRPAHHTVSVGRQEGRWGGCGFVFC